jgi:flagellar hook assembly protein FlgD
LGQNYPNPFNPSTSIDFSIPESQQVEIAIYDLLGRQVKVLVDEVLPAGSFSTVWDGTNQRNLSVSSGYYVYSMKSGKNQTVKKMLLMR